MSSIDAAIDAARAAALAAAPAPLAPATTAGAAPLPAVAPAGRPRSLADAMATAGSTVDGYLQVGFGGIQVDKSLDLLDELKVQIKLADLKFPYVVRFDVGGQTRYGKSYDGIREAQSGMSWTSVVANAQAMDQKCKGQYDAVELVFTTLEDTVLKKANKTVPAGTKLGYTTPWSGYGPAMDWVKAVVGMYGETAIVKVRLFHVPKQKGSNQWGIIDFETIG